MKKKLNTPKVSTTATPGNVGREPVAGWLLVRFAYWGMVAVLISWVALNLAGRSPLHAAESEPETPLATLEVVYGTPEERALLSFYCGPHAAAFALQHIAAVTDHAHFHRDSVFASLVQTVDPIVGKGSSLLDLKEACEAAAPVRAFGVRLETIDAARALLDADPRRALILHLAPAVGQTTGHFVTLTRERAAPVSFELDDPDAGWDGLSDGPQEPARDVRYFLHDPLDGTAPTSASHDWPGISANLAKRMSRLCLVVEPAR